MTGLPVTDTLAIILDFSPTGDLLKSRLFSPLNKIEATKYARIPGVNVIKLFTDVMYECS